MKDYPPRFEDWLTYLKICVVLAAFLLAYRLYITRGF